MFVDQVKVSLFAGAGGNGCLSFRRERGVPRGGLTEATAVKVEASTWSQTKVLNL